MGMASVLDAGSPYHSASLWENLVYTDWNQKICPNILAHNGIACSSWDKQSLRTVDSRVKKDVLQTGHFT